MLRAGLLSSPEIIEALQNDFVCTWALPETLDELIENSKDKHVVYMSINLKENFRPLVEMIVLTPGGEFVARQAMNEDIVDHFEMAASPDEPLIQYFLKFLSSSAQKSVDIAGEGPYYD